MILGVIGSRPPTRIGADFVFLLVFGCRRLILGSNTCVDMRGNGRPCVDERLFLDVRGNGRPCVDERSCLDVRGNGRP